MKKIYIIALISALLCGILVYIFLKDFSKKENTPVVQEVMDTVEVVVPVGEIPENTQITQEMVKIVKIQKDAVNPDAVLQIGEVLGKFSNVKMYPMEQILSRKLYDKTNGENNGLSLKLQKGMRAITIPVDTVSGVGGYICDGDYVDILGENGDGVPKEVLSGVKVLKVGNKAYNKDVDLYSEITFEVPISDCKKIYEAQLSGQIRLVLREKTDK